MAKLKPWPSFAATGLTLVDFFSLLGIFDSLPSPWKSLISSNGTPIVFHGPPVMQHTLFLNGKSILLDSINSKKLYWELVETTPKSTLPHDINIQLYFKITA